MKREQRILFGILEKSGFSPFQLKVYNIVCAIPWGRTRSYKWIARRLNAPNSSRAVGQALKRNPFPLIIPCHRVIKSDGGLGGFSQGRPLKKRLLDLEKTDIIVEKRGAYV
ncbi:MAG: MGMT family protein [Candidatus Omnitrophica bacterium]|nr:MGMT family protein [Candidatus Omnitrophota bacterium]